MTNEAHQDQGPGEQGKANLQGANSRTNERWAKSETWG